MTDQRHPRTSEPLVRTCCRQGHILTSARAEQMRVQARRLLQSSGQSTLSSSARRITMDTSRVSMVRQGTEGGWARGSQSDPSPLTVTKKPDRGFNVSALQLTTRQRHVMHVNRNITTSSVCRLLRRFIIASYSKWLLSLCVSSASCDFSVVDDCPCAVWLVWGQFVFTWGRGATFMSAHILDRAHFGGPGSRPNDARGLTLTAQSVLSCPPWPCNRTCIITMGMGSLHWLAHAAETWLSAERAATPCFTPRWAVHNFTRYPASTKVPHPTRLM